MKSKAGDQAKKERQRVTRRYLHLYVPGKSRVRRLIIRAFRVFIVLGSKGRVRFLSSIPTISGSTRFTAREDQSFLMKILCQQAHFWMMLLFYRADIREWS